MGVETPLRATLGRYMRTVQDMIPVTTEGLAGISTRRVRRLAAGSRSDGPLGEAA